MYVFGESDGTNSFNDLYILKTANFKWSKLQLSHRIVKFFDYSSSILSRVFLCLKNYAKLLLTGKALLLINHKLVPLNVL